MICPRCQNSDERYFYLKNGEYYCRKCIGYGRKEKLDDRPVKDKQVEVCLDYPLSSIQQDASHKLVERYKNHHNTLIKAVCGAGKTEIIYEVIAYALNHQQRVCLTIPRKELVVELSNRIKQQMKGIEPTIVYGGCTQELTGDFIICTTHQLYRYPDYFDLLILDEMDAFPYAFDEVLHQFLQASIKGNYIFMSATIDKGDINIHERFHHQPIPVPRFMKAGKIVSLILIVLKIRQFQLEKKPVLLYVAKIEDTYRMRRYLEIFHFRCAIAHSQETNIQKNLQKLKEHLLDVVVTTTVLERGMTLENVQVIVFEGHHRLYTSDTLIQIAGRAGRKMNYTDGEILFFGARLTKEMKQCIRQIERDNALSVLKI